MALFNPFAIWTNFALKSGEAMLTAAQAAVARREVPTVAVIRTDDAPALTTSGARTPKAKSKTLPKSSRARARRRR